MSEKIENLTEKLNTTTDEVMQKKLDFGRETALKEQTLSFKESKIADLQSQIADLSSKYEERISQ